MQNPTFEVWAGYDPDDLQHITSFTTKEEALASAENLYDAYDLVEIIEERDS